MGKRKKSLVGWIEEDEFRLFWILENSGISIPHLHKTIEDYRFMHLPYKINNKTWKQTKIIVKKVRITLEEL